MFALKGKRTTDYWEVPCLKISNSIYEIEITEDSTYRLFSMDNKVYDLICKMEDYGRSSHYKTLSISVFNWTNENSKKIAVIGGIYSFTIEDCAVLDGDELIVLMQDSVVIFDLKNNELVCKKRVVTMGTAFHIYSYKDSYVIHGELEIVLMNKMGEIIWSFSGRDIFVLSEENENLQVFSIAREYIIVYDWQGNKYVLDEYGNEVNDSLFFSE